MSRLFCTVSLEDFKNFGTRDTDIGHCQDQALGTTHHGSELKGQLLPADSVPWVLAQTPHKSQLPSNAECISLSLFLSFHFSTCSVCLEEAAHLNQNNGLRA